MRPSCFVVATALSLVFSAHAATRYVNLNNPSPTAPYTNWTTAATNIQDAVDAAVVGDLVLVTNGVYQSGVQVVYGMSNRVAVTKPVALQSVNGPTVTHIVGYQVPGTTNGLGAVRCVYLTNGASISGFTLANGATQYPGQHDSHASGGGVWCESTAAVLTNCVLRGNSALYRGGGVSGGTLDDCTLEANSAWFGGGASGTTLNNCIVTGNSASGSGGGTYEATLNTCTLSGNSAARDGGGAQGGRLNNCRLVGNRASDKGGGAYAGTLNNCIVTGNSASTGGGIHLSLLSNCTVTGNNASYGGGASFSTLNNSILYFNTAHLRGDNHDGVTCHYCCTTPLPLYGDGIILSDPQLASGSYLSADSPCRAAGSVAYAGGFDIDGEPWSNPPSIGSDEYWNGSATGALSAGIQAAYTNVAVGFKVDFQALIEGRANASRWDFGDGVVVSNQPYASHAWTAAGEYHVELRVYSDSYPEGIVAALSVFVEAPIHYVALTSTNPVPPYGSWATAATSIQDAVDAAFVPGALVLVSNGVYETGARQVHNMSNRVAVTKAITLQSVNGPALTHIVGYQVTGTTNGAEAVRCVYLANGAALAGFTLTNGATQNSGDEDRQQSGGGVWCESSHATLTNCVLIGNSASEFGGAAYQGTLLKCAVSSNSARAGGGASRAILNNCRVSGNSAVYGGGAYLSALNNCTLMGNSAAYGGGAYSSSPQGDSQNSALNNCTLTGNSASEQGGGAFLCELNNSIVFFNTAQREGKNYYQGRLNHCCTTPLPPAGIGNISADPHLASFSHLGVESPCRAAGGGAYASGLDIDGEFWADPPSIGCDEYWSGSTTGAMSARIVAACSDVAVGFAADFQAEVEGRVSATTWDFGDGVVVSNQPYASHIWAAPGEYLVELRAHNEDYPNGVVTALRVRVHPRPIHYVSSASPYPAPPYSSWATAAATIQDALDAAVLPGALILVSNGVYQAGARAVYGMSNRVAVTKPVTVQSINGPEVTHIVGYQVPGTTNGPSAVRCAYLADGAVLSGFTLANGATQSSGTWDRQLAGGAVWCETYNAIVTNCVLMGNSALYGGGAFFGTLHNCTLTANSAFYGGGALQSTLENCTLAENRASATGGGACEALLNNCTLAGNWSTSGGGASESMLNSCTLTGNSAGYGGGAVRSTLKNCNLISNSAGYGGGAHYADLINCFLTRNSASADGGGTLEGTLNNCTLIANSARSGGGAFSGKLYNCIVYFNTAQKGDNHEAEVHMAYCCTTPMPLYGVGNITADPQLASIPRLSADSPCRGAGNVSYTSGLDIDGEPWGERPSIGCDEFWLNSPTGTLSAGIIVAYTNVAVGSVLDFQAAIDGHASASRWDFGDGVVVLNQSFASHAWAIPGEYVVELRAYNNSHPEGVAAGLIVRVEPEPVHYVMLASSNPVAPFTSWATAATNIQDAVDAATIPGALVLVSNGVYAVGARAVYSMSNRVAVTKPVRVQSLNGPAVTHIVGYQVPGITNGPDAVRCVYLTNGAVLAGFTLTNGATQIAGEYRKQRSGGAVWCESRDSIVADCVLTGNAAQESGGGSYHGTISNCTFRGNSAGYGGGGGASSGRLNNCVLTSNNAWEGGGAYSGTLNNCTLAANSAVNKGGGAFESTLNNCIVYFNTAGFSGTNYEGGTLNHCCTTPFAGYGNLTGDPQFVDVSGWANLRLRFNSPCIDTAENSYAPGPKDLDGNQRVSGGKVDIGAYEFQFTDQEVPHANVGSEVVKSGEHGCLPVYLESSDELTDLAVTFESAQGLSISSASPVGTEVQSAVVDRLNSNQAVLRVKAKPGQVLRGPKHVANVCFALWSGQPSAFLPLQVVSVRGLRPDAVAVNNNVIEGGSGRVVAIGNEPLLEMTTVTGNTLLTVYGQPGSLLLVESKPVLDGDPQSWQPAFTVEIPSTNLWQTISLEPTNQTMFYRARSQ